MATDIECDQTKLNAFSRNHFTYINQYFGNAAVRDIIMERYPSDKYTLISKLVTNDDFEEGYHHLVYDKENDKTICSVDDQKQQNPNIDKEDTLCQTYSLLTYLNFIFPEKGYQLPPRNESIDYKIEKQRIMVRMYRDLLSDEELVKLFKNKLEYPYVWFKNFIYYKNGEPVGSGFTIGMIITQIKKVLDIWEDYGFYAFIGKGNCPKPKRKADDISDEVIDTPLEPRRVRVRIGGKTHKKRKNNRTTRRYRI